ncbi:hypothetical protein [Parapedobacter tibetensis]|uniref:hypothetical protein n=1 Tax=Parapedobacter tibetensis TaxID=2972951 RepID=UPI00214DE0A2|nr:hypothetical protein [Parapedobacter tibetensis]
MRIIWIVWTGLLVQACSISRQRHSQSSRTASAQKTFVHHEWRNRQDTLTEIFAGQLEVGHQVLAITPIGAFTYHPDSGFSGNASEIFVYRKQTKRTDTLRRSQGSETTQVSAGEAAIHHEKTAHVSESRDARHAFRVPWWLAIGGVILIALLFRFVFRRWL